MHPVKYLWAFRALAIKPFFRSIGKRCYIGKPLFMSGLKRIRIGNEVRIFPGLRIEALDRGSVEIGNDTVIEQNVHIISMRENLLIGEEVTIAPNVFITNVNHEYKDPGKGVMKQGYLVQKTQIGDRCFLGYGASIQAGTILGKHCIVGSNSIVKGTFPDNCVIVGNPAKIIKKYNDKTNNWEKV